MIITRTIHEWIQHIHRGYAFIDVIDIREEDGSCVVVYHCGSYNPSNSHRIFY